MATQDKPTVELTDYQAYRRANTSIWRGLLIATLFLILGAYMLVNDWMVTSLLVNTAALVVLSVVFAGLEDGYARQLWDNIFGIFGVDHDWYRYDLRAEYNNER